MQRPFFTLAAMLFGKEVMLPQSTEKLVGLFEKQLMIALQNHAAPFRSVGMISQQACHTLSGAQKYGPRPLPWLEAMRAVKSAAVNQRRKFISGSAVDISSMDSINREAMIERVFALNVFLVFI